MSRQEEAMRIMEALSGVDEELLARCEAAGMAGTGEGAEDSWKSTADSLKDVGRLTGRKRKQQGSRLWRYLSRCAAVLALAAVGAASWSGLRVMRDATVNESASGGSPEAAVMDFAFNSELEEGSADNMISESKLAGKDMREGADGAVPMPAATNSGTNDTNGMGSAGDVSYGLDDTGHLDAIKEELSVGRVTSAARMLTEDEARQTDLLGSYVPTSLPAGYAFKSAQYDEATGRLTIRWGKGTDEIMLSFEQVDSDNFSDPVFAKDDFSLEIVRSCVLSYSGDSGDTSTPRGQFSVLYDGVLVYFNGRGTPEEIWEMFASIAEQ